MAILVLVGHLLTSLYRYSTKVSSWCFLFFLEQGPLERQQLPALCLYSTENKQSSLGLLVPVLSVCRKLKAQQSLPVPQTQPRKMHKARSHRPLTNCLSKSRKSTSKGQQELFLTEILQNQQHYSNKQLKHSIWIHTFWKLTSHFMFSSTPSRLWSRLPVQSSQYIP